MDFEGHRYSGPKVREPEVDPTAADAVEDFFVLLRRMSDYFTQTCAAFDLTPQPGAVLRGLSAPSPMRELARRLGMDASNLTGVVDRLEERGLVERRADPADRRVRQLALTDDGEQLRRALEARLMSAPPLLAGLDEEQRRTLRDLLRRAAAAT